MPAAPIDPGARAAAAQQDDSHHGGGVFFEGDAAAAAAPALVPVVAAADDAPPPPATLFAAVDIAEDEPHPEGLVARAALGAAAAEEQGAGGGGGGPGAGSARQRLGRRYFRKMKGGLDHPPPVPHFADLVWSFVGAFAAILAVSGLDAALWGLPPATRAYDVSFSSSSSSLAPAPTATTATSPPPHPLGALPVLVASFGASAVLLFGAPESKLSQPRGCVGGHVLSAIVGVLARLALGETGARAPAYVVAALGMALALTVMQLTQTTHPPGGATALIACTAPGVVSLQAWYGARFVLAVALGSVVMMVCAVLANNLAADRAYPTYWWWGTRGPPRWCCGLAGGAAWRGRRKEQRQQPKAPAASSASSAPPA